MPPASHICKKLRSDLLREITDSIGNDTDYISEHSIKINRETGAIIDIWLARAALARLEELGKQFVFPGVKGFTKVQSDTGANKYEFYLPSRTFLKDDGSEWVAHTHFVTPFLSTNISPLSKLVHAALSLCKEFGDPEGVDGIGETTWSTRYEMIDSLRSAMFAGVLQKYVIPRNCVFSLPQNATCTLRDATAQIIELRFDSEISLYISHNTYKNDNSVHTTNDEAVELYINNVLSIAKDLNYCGQLWHGDSNGSKVMMDNLEMMWKITDQPHLSTAHEEF